MLNWPPNTSFCSLDLTCAGKTKKNKTKQKAKEILDWAFSWANKRIKEIRGKYDWPQQEKN